MKKSLFGLLATAFCVSALAGGPAKFAAHEWGTFTSVQGADGIQMEWNPFVAAELPNFVYDRNRPNHEGNRGQAIFWGKTAFVARQRMETPVIYFYSAEKKTVDVRVDFPSGLMTEWYPHASSCDSDRLPAGSPRPKNSYLEWKGIEVAAGNEPSADKLPIEKGKSHYYAARETDASLIRIKNETRNLAETEKFLFYRGVGHFEAPLKVTMANESQLLLNNNGKEDLLHLLVLKVTGQTFSVLTLDKLSPNTTQRVDMAKARAGTRDDLKASLVKSLTAEGLFEAEAKAMVKTWEDSWLDEQGLRVLYVLGTKWTDRTLPLKIKPQPEETVRVMVGRAEVIAPSIEIALQESIKQYMKGNQNQAVQSARTLGLGRFQEAAVRRLIKTNPGEAFSRAAFELISKTADVSKEKPLALK